MLQTPYTRPQAAVVLQTLNSTHLRSYRQHCAMVHHLAGMGTWLPRARNMRAREGVNSGRRDIRRPPLSCSWGACKLWLFLAPDAA